MHDSLKKYAQNNPMGPDMNPIESVFLPKTKWYGRRQTEKWLLASVDVIALMMAFCVSSLVLHFVKRTAMSPSITTFLEAQDIIRLQTYLVLLACAIVAFWAKGHYSKRRPISNEIREMLNITVVLALVDAALVFFGKWHFSRSALLLNWVLAPGFLLLLRVALKYLMMRGGGWTRPIVIIGWGENAIETALAFEDEKLMGMALTAFMIPNGRAKVQHQLTDRFGLPIPCISLGPDPAHTLGRLGNPHVVLALEQGGIDSYQDLVQLLSRNNRDIQIVPSLRGLPLYGMEINHFFAHEVLLLRVRNNLARRFPQLVKRAFDLVVSISVLVLGSPLLLWIAAKVAASGRPIFYGHQRIGQHNKSFACYKFRTMAPNSDQLLLELLATDPEAKAEWERDFKLKDDPRVTPIGKFLRKTSLDELPQLWNVLRGDMSLVGPRPVVTAELERYGNQVDYYLEAKPGVTGLWQISGRNDVSYDTRVYLDAWYVKNWSLFNDIVILFRTVKVIFKKDGAY